MLSEQGQVVCDKLETKCSAMLGVVAGAAKIIMGNTAKTKQLENYICTQQQDVHAAKVRLDATPVKQEKE